MRYFFTAIFAITAACFSLVLAWTIVLGITNGWEWFLVSVGILIPNVVLVLITSAAYSAAKDY